MNEQKSIICAVDLSWRSEGAFTYALALAKSRRALLDLLCALSGRQPFSRGDRDPDAQIAELRRRASAVDVDMAVTVQQGRPADLILRHAKTSAISTPQWIVLGAPSRRGFRLFSVAQAVVHQTVCPTLVVPSPEVTTSVGVPFRRLLCAIDFSSASRSALDEASELIRYDGGTMRLLHVVDVVQPAVPRLETEFPAIEYAEQRRKHAWRQLRRLLPLSQALYGRVQVDVAVGVAVDEIMRSANEFNADLIVLGVKKCSTLARLLGSTTDHVLRKAGCPVLAVPERRTRSRADADLNTIPA